MPKRLLAFVCLAAPLVAQTPPPPRIFDAPVYQLANGVLFDASRGMFVLPANNGIGNTPSGSCTSGQTQISGGGLYFCGTAGWVQVSGLSNGKIAANLLPTLDQLSGTLLSTQLPATIAANTTGNAGTATALAATPTLAPTGQYCTGVTTHGNCIPAQVQWTQIGSIPSLVLQSQIGAAGGVAGLGSDTKISLTLLPTIPYTQLSGTPTLGTIASHAAGEYLVSTLLNAPNGVLGTDGAGLVPLSALPTIPNTKISGLGTASTHPASDFATGAAATTSTLGLVQIGNGLLVTNGLLSVNTSLFDAAGSATSAVAGIPVSGSSQTLPALLSVADRTAFAAKQPALGYTPENPVNKGAANGYAPLNNLSLIPNANLPIATSGTAGLVKPGTNLTVTADGTLNATATTVPLATANTAGLVKPGTNMTVDVNGSLNVATTTVPLASANTTGVVKPGANMTVSGDGSLNVAAPYSLPAASANALGGVRSATPVTHQFVTGIATSGSVTTAQPDIADISGIGTAASHPASDFLSSALLGQPNGVQATDSAGLLPLSSLPTIPNTKISGLGSASTHPAADFATSAAATTSTPGLVQVGNGLLVTNGLLSVNSALFDTAGAATSAVAAIPVSSGAQTQPALLSTADRATFAAKQSALGFTPENAANKGAANGYAPLGNLATIPVANLPIASSNAVGAVKPGTNMTVSADGSLNVAAPFALLAAGVNTLGGVKSFAPVTHQFLTGISTSGAAIAAQPDLGDLTGVGTAAAHPATDFVLASSLGQPGGVPTLNGSGVIPSAQMGLANQTVQVNGSALPSYLKTNLVAGTNVTLAATNNGTDTNTITISASGSGGNGGTGTTYNAGTGLTLSGGTFALASVNLSPGQCGDATHVCQVTTDAYGRVTGQLAVAVTGGSGNGNVTGSSFITGNLVKAGGPASLVDTGFAPPTSAIVGVSDAQSLTNKQIDATELTSGSLPVARMPAFTGDASSSLGTNVLTFANVNANPGACGDATHVCQVTTDSKGRVLSETAVPVTAGTLGGGAFTSGNVPVATGTTSLADSGFAIPLSPFVGISDTQTLTNKSIGALEINSGTLNAARLPAFTGDVTSVAGTSVLTLPAVNASTGTFGDGTHTAAVTVNAKGQITGVTSVPITAGGTGTVTNGSGALTTGSLLVGNGGADLKTGNLTGDVLTSGSTVATLATVNTTPGQCGDTSHVCQVTTDAKGRVTGQSAISITQSGTVSGGSFVTGHVPIATGASALGDSGFGPPSSAFVGISDAQVLTNKSIAATQLTGTVPAGQMPALTGDITTAQGSVATSLATANGAPGQCGDGTHVCQVTTDAKGRVTAQAAVAITTGGSGTVTNTGGTLASGAIVLGNGGADLKSGNLTGDISTSGTAATTLATVNLTPGSYGNATTVPRITVDAKGRVTSVAEFAITANSGNGNSGTAAIPFVQTFTNQSTVSLAHGFNTKNLVIACEDTAGNVIEAGSAQFTDNNTAVVAFAGARSGSCTVMGGLGVAPGSFAFTNQTTVSITHNLNTQNVLVGCYSATNASLTPTQVLVVDNNTVTVTFGSAQNGHCIVNGGIGPQGPQGPQGPSGAAASRYTFALTSATAYTISNSTHNLNTADLNLNCRDSAGNRFGAVLQVNPSTYAAQVSFRAAKSGGACTLF